MVAVTHNYLILSCPFLELVLLAILRIQIILCKRICGVSNGFIQGSRQQLQAVQKKGSGCSPTFFWGGFSALEYTLFCSIWPDDLCCTTFPRWSCELILQMVNLFNIDVTGYFGNHISVPAPLPKCALLVQKSPCHESLNLEAWNLYHVLQIWWNLSKLYASLLDVNEEQCGIQLFEHIQ